MEILFVISPLLETSRKRFISLYQIAPISSALVFAQLLFERAVSASTFGSQPSRCSGYMIGCKFLSMGWKTVKLLKNDERSRLCEADRLCLIDGTYSSNEKG